MPPHRRSLGLLLAVRLSLLLLPSTVLAVGDLVERLYIAERDDVAVPALGLTTRDLPDKVKNRLALNKLEWTELSNHLQRALLWDSGFVLAPDGAPIQVFAVPSLTMAELQVDLKTATNISDGTPNCGLLKCRDDNHFLESTCPTAKLATVARCAIQRSAISHFADTRYAGAFWAEDGHDRRVPQPILRLHNAGTSNQSDASSDAEMLFAIHLEDAAFMDATSCAIEGWFIVPCRVHHDADEAVMEEVESGVAVDVWMLAVARKKSRLSTGVLVVLLVLGTLVVLLAALVAVQYRRRQHFKTALASPMTQLISVEQADLRYDLYAHKDPSDANVAMLAESPILQQFVEDPAIVTKRIAFSQIMLLRVLSKGASGEVWLGQFESRYVAMKCLLATKRRDLRALEQFSDEIRLASVLEHPRIVEFCGVAWHSLSSLSIVTEYMERGDLEAFLAQPEAKQLTWSRDKLALAKDIADALVYLHSLAPVVVHRDLKSKNIMLDAQMHAKLSDFGLSRETSPDGTMTNGVGTILWSAPEVLEGRQYDEKADIFSFGVVLSEIDTCALPYGFSKDKTQSKMKSMQIVHLVSQGKKLPSFRDDCPREIVALACQCLDLDPARRPSALQVVFALQSLGATASPNAAR